MRAALLAAALGAGLAAPLGAQPLDSLPVGARVRLGRAAVVELSAGRRSMGEAFQRGARTGALIGLAVGAVATAVVAVGDVANAGRSGGPNAPYVAFAGSVLAVYTGAVGGVLGLTQRERWRRVHPPR